MTAAARLALPLLFVNAAAGAGCSDISASGQTGAKAFDAMSSEEHLDCAVDISAYTYLIVGKKVATNKEGYSQSLLALGWHHNAYAVPLGEGEQHDLINRLRAELIAKEAPAAIEERAIECIVLAEAKHAEG